MTLCSASGSAERTMCCIAADVQLGRNVKIYSFVNLYGCRIGDDTVIGPFVEITRGVTIGRCCKIQSHSFICDGVDIEDEVFVGHGVMFVNDRFPQATTNSGKRVTTEWTRERTVIRRRASIGSGAIIMGGIEVGQGALIGAGAVVTRDVRPDAVVAGVPARLIRPTREPRGPTGDGIGQALQAMAAMPPNGARAPHGVESHLPGGPVDSRSGRVRRAP
jgi:acetyltransferase-like isoleucine patch superfamily enzyme